MARSGGRLARLARLRASSFGTLAQGTLRFDESIEAVVAHVREGLAALCARGLREDLPEHETGLTQTLVTELESRVGYRPYFFQQEHLENVRSGKSPRVDIAVQARGDHPVVVSGVLGNGDRFFSLEAKRLPTPGTGREREYVAGTRGAIERYKLGLHGRGLRCVGIIGYVQNRTFSFWRDAVNGWVDELQADSASRSKWDEYDKLQMEYSTLRLAQLRSASLRQSDDVRVTIRHLWVLLGQPSLSSGGTRARRARRDVRKAPKSDGRGRSRSM